MEERKKKNNNRILHQSNSRGCVRLLRLADKLLPRFHFSRNATAASGKRQAPDRVPPERLRGSQSRQPFETARDESAK